MRRRSFLATLGILGLGGCTDDAQPATPTQTPTSTNPPENDAAHTITTPPSPTAEIVSESFDVDTLTYDVTLDVNLDGAEKLEATIRENRIGNESKRTMKFTSSGRKTLTGIGAMAFLRLNAPGTPMFVPKTHIVGTTDVVSLEPQARFRDIHFSTLPDIDPKKTFGRRFEWRFQRQDMWFEVGIPKGLYRYCRNRPRVDQYGFYGGDTFNDAFINHISTQFTGQGNLSKREQVDLAISFVQSLKYTSDSVTAGYDEYQRYPAETLVDRGGDCEDSAILLGSILKHMGYGIRGVLLPGHMGLAVKGDESIPGVYYEQNGDRYYYVETTGKGWRVGDMPDDYRGEPARLVPLTGYPCLNFEFETMDVEHGENVFVYIVHNSGDAAARQVRFDVEFVNREGRTVTGKRYRKGDLGAGEARQEMVMVPLPKEKLSVKVRTSAYLGGELHARHETPYL